MAEQQDEFYNENYGNINPNRPLHIRKTAVGVEVYMYLDRPGIFLDHHGNEVKPELARAAGYDVDTLVKERRKTEAFSKARAQIEQQYATTKTREIVEEKGEYKLVHVGNDMYNIEHSDGSVMNKERMSKKEAEDTFAALS